MFLERYLPLDYRRRRLLAKCGKGPLCDYLQQPFPSTTADCHALPMVAIDLETTGVDASQHEIVSIGLVTIHGLQIDLGSAHHYLVRPEQKLTEQSVVIHRITDDQAQQGRPIAEIMAILLQQLAGKVLVAHHARFEVDFIDAACRRLYQCQFIAPVIDTLSLERRRRERSNRVYRAHGLRLDALRQEYNLPRYRAHNALSDALAAAELLLAQIAQSDLGKPLPLGDFLMHH